MTERTRTPAREELPNGRSQAEETPPDREELTRALTQEREARVKKCNEELAAVLKKHDCGLVSYQELINGMPRGPAVVQVVPN